MTSEYWITGHKSGLGKFLLSSLKPSRAFDPRKNVVDLNKETLSNITLINCGFKRINHNEEVNLVSFDANVSNQLKLSKIPFKRSIICSSIDVYPNDNKMNIESREIKNKDITSIYAYQKLLVENFFLNNQSNSTVMRLPMLIGRECKDNTVIKLLKGEDLRLCENSTINVVEYNHILNFIKCVEHINLNGVYNIVASQNAVLGDIANILNIKPSFGKYLYMTPSISNKKLDNYFSDLNRSTADIIKNFAVNASF